MTAGSRPTEKSDRELAAGLAAAVIRFEGGAAHQLGIHVSHARATAPIGIYRFVPAAGESSTEGLPAFLGALPSPVFLSHTALRGAVAFTLLTDVDVARRARMQEELNVQRAHLESRILELGIEGTTDVLPELESEQHAVPLSAVRLWCDLFRFEQVGMDVGSAA